MRELYSYTGMVYVVRLAGSIVMLHVICCLLIVIEISGLSIYSKIPFYCASYLCGFLVIGLLFRGISHEINRLGLVSWIPTFRYKIIPFLFFAGICACIAHCLFVSGKPTLAKLAVLLPLCIGLFLWLRMFLWVYRIRKRKRIKWERRLELCAQFESQGDISRLQESICMALGRNLSVPTTNQRDFVLRGLTEKPWHDAAQFSWRLVFENNFDAIRKEILDSLSSRATTPYSYPGVVKGEWNSLMLVAGRKVIGKNRALFPRLFECLEKVPHFPIFGEVLISIVAAGSRILPHRDESNVYVTGHFGVQIPSDCGICVAGEKRSWEEGKFLFFSAEYEHSVWNDSNSDRIVLIIDFLHPEVTDLEAKFFGAES